MAERKELRRTTASREEQLRTLIRLLTPNVSRDLELHASGHNMNEVIKEGRATRATTLDLGLRMLLAAEQELEELTGQSLT